MSASPYEDEKRVARSNRAFYQAFEALDLARMKAVWSQRPEIQCVHPGGEALIGPALVHGSWATIFAHTESIRFELVDLNIQVLGELAWVSNIERIRVPREPGVPSGGLLSEAQATNLFRREAESWLMVLHHASPIARRFG